MNIQIKNGRVIDPAQQLDRVTDIYVADSTIAAIGQCPPDFSIDQIIDATDQYVFPGAIDLCARTREPGQEHTATILSESKAAVAGGVTTLCCPPDTNPIIDTPAVAELIHQRAHSAGFCRVLPIAAATHGLDGKTLTEMHALKQIGCIAVSNAYQPINDSEVLRRVLEYAYTCGVTMMLFCEDESLRKKGTAHEGIISMQLGLPGIPESAETTAISRAILLAEHCGQQLHICRLSSARSVEMVQEAKSRGLAVTADVSIHQLYLTEQDLSNFNASCHLRPPLRTEQDRIALIAGIKQGIIDCVCSDHQPHDDDAKSAPFSLTEPGASSIEHFVPLVINQASLSSIDIATLIRTVSHNPASLLKLDSGSIAQGKPADICIFDPNRSFTIDRNNMISAGKNTAFDQMTVSGQIVKTLVDGKIVFEK